MPKAYPWGKATERYMLCVPAWLDVALREIKLAHPEYQTMSHLCLDIVVQAAAAAGYRQPETPYESPLAGLFAEGEPTPSRSVPAAKRSPRGHR